MSTKQFYLTGKQYSSDMDFWRDLILENSEICMLKGDIIEKNVAVGKQDLNFELHEKGKNNLEKFSEGRDMEQFILWVSALAYVLSKYMGSDKITVLSPSLKQENQSLPLETLIPLFLEINPECSLKEHIINTGALLKEFYGRQNFPLDLIETADQEPFSSLDVSNILVSYQGFHNSPPNLEIPSGGLHINILSSENGNKACFNISYDQEVFSAFFIQQLSKHLISILDQYTDVQSTLLDLKLLSDVEIRKVTEAFNQTEKDWGYNSVLEAFKDIVLYYPNQKALTYGSTSYSYRELDDISDQLSHQLKADYDFSSGQKVVGVLLEKSDLWIISLLGILKAGGCYLPLTLKDATSRRKHILKKSGLDLVITQSIEDPISGVPSFYIDQFINTAKNTCQIEKGEFPKADIPAYILFTSGSTGNPKGVEISHLGLLNVAMHYVNSFKINAKDCYLQFMSNSFDGSILDVFAALLSGAHLVLPEENVIHNTHLFQAFMQEHSVSITVLTPSYIQTLGRKIPESLRVLISAGEAVNVEDANFFASKLNFYNVYGPTEAAVATTQFAVLKNIIHSRIPIGAPISNRKTYILDQQLQALPIGAKGEIFIGGIGVAKKYLGEPELSKHSFIENPFIPGTSIYRTGDNGRWLQDGTIEYLGRADDQVKIRGYRVELEEIKRQITKYPTFSDAVVVYDSFSNDTETLVAVLLAPEQGSATLQEFNDPTFQTWIKSMLPPYMQPQSFFIIKEYPRTSSDKVDKKLLAEWIKPLMVPKKGILPPQNKTEEQLVQLFSDLFNIPVTQIGRNSNFFELGGHSLAALKLISMIYDQFGKAIQIQDIFANVHISELGLFVDNCAVEEIIAIPNVSNEVENGAFPLSDKQEQIWLIEQQQKSQIGFIVPLYQKLKGALNIDTLRNALILLLNRHDSLRTIIKNIDGKPHQLILPKITEADPLEYHDIRSMENRNEWLVKEAREEAQTPFNIEQGPLFRVKLFCTGENEHVIFLTMHHLITDEVSMVNMYKEIIEVYNNLLISPAYSLAPLDIQYTDYTLWLKEHYEENTNHEYWLKELASPIPALELVTDYKRPKTKSYDGDKVMFTIDAATTSKLLAFCNSRDINLYMLYATILNFLLHRYSGQNDIIIGSPVRGREHSQLTDQIGFFINMLAFRTQINPAQSFESLLMQIKEKTLSGYEHESYSIKKLMEGLNRSNATPETSLFNVYFDLSVDATDIYDFPEMTGLEFETFDFGFEKCVYDLEVIINQRKDDLECFLTYSTDLFERARIEALAEHIRNITRMLVEEEASIANSSLNKIKFLTKKEDELLARFNTTQKEYPSNWSIPEAFEFQAAAHPDACALVFEGRQYSYREINENANRIAHYLNETIKIKAEEPVAVYFENSVDYLFSILGILKAGGAYVPFDVTTSNNKRFKDIIQTNNIRAIFTQTHLLEELSFFEGSIFAVDLQLPVIDTSTENLKKKPSSDSLAYIMFTSGSTGKPKGVMIEHRNVVNLAYNTHAFGLKEGQQALLTGALGFDATTFDIWRTLIQGYTLHLIPNKALKEVGTLREAILDRKIELIFLTTQWFNFLVDSDLELFKPLKVLITGGDVVSTSHVNQLRAAYPDLSIIHAYGPTENTTFSTFHNVTSTWERTVPIGKPLDNRSVFILDDDLQTVPIGVIGEICLGGDGLARGYLGDPTLSAEKFVTPGSLGGKRIYRTGDLGYFLKDGSVIFSGRKDNQVKIRGYRVELFEILSVLNQHPLLKDIYIYPFQKPGVEKLLRGVLIPDSRKRLSDLKERLLVRTNQLDLSSLFQLPNGMSIHYKNRKETAFIYEEIFEDNIYLKEGIQLNEGDTVLYVGANIGLFTLYLMVNYPSLNIYAFEPLQPIFDVLEKNCQLYDFKGKLFNIGLSDKKSVETFYYFPYYTSASGRYANSDHQKEIVKQFMENEASTGLEVSEAQLNEMLDTRMITEKYEVEIKTVSDIIRENDIEQIDLLKLDCEKSEIDVIMGIEKEHWKKVRQVVIEIHDEEDILGTIVEKLNEEGFTVKYEQAGNLQDTTLYNLYAIKEDVVNEDQSDAFAPLENLNEEALIKQIRTFGTDLLPAYMIPQEFIVLDELPLNKNGKVDKELVNLLFDTQKEVHKEGFAPATEQEKLIAGIWSEVLRQKSINTTDNFFDLGGDSIKAIQISSRLHKIGIKVDVKDVFQHQTIQAIISHLTTLSHTPDQAPLIGQIPLTPVQREFFEWNLEEAHHFNQSLLLECPEHINVVQLEAIFTKLKAHHDMLRMTFKLKNGKYQQLCAAPGEQVKIETYNLSASLDIQEAIDNITEQIQQSLNIEEQPWKVVLLNFQSTKRLFLAVHHLIIDSVSWRVLFEDFTSLYEKYQNGQELTLPLKTDSIKAWMESLQQYAQSEKLLREKTYWQKIQAVDVKPIKRDLKHQENYFRDQVKIQFLLSKKQTKSLLTDARKVFKTEINDLLLAALAKAIFNTFGVTKQRIALEGHGREHVVQNINITHTIGWFTSLFPILLEFASGDSIESNIQKTKEMLNNIPERGIGYGILKHLTPDHLKEGMHFHAKPKICFNYLGQFDSDVEKSVFNVAEEEISSEIGSKNERIYDLEFSGSVLNDQLLMSVSFNAFHFEINTMQNLMLNYEQAIGEYLTYCLEKGQQASDEFTAKHIPDDNLEKLNKIFN